MPAAGCFGAPTAAPARSPSCRSAQTPGTNATGRSAPTRRRSRGRQSGAPSGRARGRARCRSGHSGGYHPRDRGRARGHRDGGRHGGHPRRPPPGRGGAVRRPRDRRDCGGHRPGGRRPVRRRRRGRRPPRTGSDPRRGAHRAPAPRGHRASRRAGAAGGCHRPRERPRGPRLTATRRPPTRAQAGRPVHARGPGACHLLAHRRVSARRTPRGGDEPPEPVVTVSHAIGAGVRYSHRRTPLGREYR